MRRIRLKWCRSQMWSVEGIESGLARGVWTDYIRRA